MRRVYSEPRLAVNKYVSPPCPTGYALVALRPLVHDASLMASMLRWRNLPEMLTHSGVLDRMVHGSDFPFPSNGLVFWNRLPPRLTGRLAQEQNLLERDLQLKRALKIPQAVIERGAKLLGLGSGEELLGRVALAGPSDGDDVQRREIR